MTVQASQAYSGPYNANGVTTAFPFSFPCQKTADVAVQVAGVKVTSGFTVSLNANQSTNPGGTVTFTTAPSSGQVYVYAALTFDQQTAFSLVVPWSAGTVAGQNAANDRAALRDQILARDLGRAIKAPLGEAPAALPAAASRANLYLGFDANGNPIATSGTAVDGILRGYLPIGQGSAMVSYTSVTAAGGLAASIVPAVVTMVSVKEYYGDGLELNSGARWMVSPVQSSGSGRRQSADGRWWQIAEPVIDPCMLGARSSDRTTDSTTAILEALAFANADLGDGLSHDVSGARTVRLNPPAKNQSYQVANGAYCISAPLILNNGGSLEIAPGAELLCLGSFSGSMAIGTSNTSAYGVGGSIIVKGFVNCNSVTSGIWLRSGVGFFIDTRSGVFVNCKIFGVQIGDPSLSSPVYEAKIYLGRFTTTPVSTYAAAQTANDPTSIGLWMTSKSSDNRIHGGELIGFRTGYQDDGADNDMEGVHPYTFGNSTGSHPTFYGPLVTAFQLNGSSATIQNIEADTPTSMGNSGITDVYGLVFGSTATGYKVFGYQCFLNWDDAGASVGSSGLCTAIMVNAFDQSGSNCVECGYFDSVSTSIAYKWGIAGSPSYLVRRNIGYSSRAAFTGGVSGDIRGTLNRPDIQTTTTADRRRNWIRNSAFSLWQRGTSFNVGAASTTVFGPDRWASYSDGSGTRTISQYQATLAEASSYNVLSASYAMRVAQSASSGGTYWHIEQKISAGALQGLAQKRMTFQLAQKLNSGTLPSVIKVGLRQSFGTGGAPSADVFTEYALAVVPGSSFGRQYVTVTWPSIAGKTLGTSGWFASIYIALPITGTWDISLTEMMLTDGTEQVLFEYPDDGEELRDAQRYFEIVNGWTINGSTWVGCQAKANTPTVAATAGTVTQSTVNGALMTNASQAATTITFTASEP